MAHGIYLEDEIAELKQRVDALASLLGRVALRTADLHDPSEGPAPTYVSGSTPGKVYAIHDMPTRYLKNVRNMTDERVAAGVRREIEAELRHRDLVGAVSDWRARKA